jgi:hypothetical protein
MRGDTPRNLPVTCILRPRCHAFALSKNESREEGRNGVTIPLIQS